MAESKSDLEKIILAVMALREACFSMSGRLTEFYVTRPVYLALQHHADQPNYFLTKNFNETLDIQICGVKIKIEEVKS